ncbi:MAG: uroporphyrinogen decarboxylase [Sphaerobacter thermophilus]|uniref:Uroporphyrinogen decarboxylase n=1 Tax=Sphaerobacter thermophilus (strain ATCC 49802 / DSM 20745 / KCCM 41009 / NCIMB 13125 / S 6022) TaxID=479434 RepID=D1C799_SPHTD|nr:uroporphyrinogen decarboxylase [Sphaerobacter thermophilus]ACZ39745.1 uroporphyrinogen decarboxylase [Sphaerobacter thermophilus DSM 20745]
MADGITAADRFLRACRREPVDRTPVWFMRQAGRYMAEYRAIRARHTLLEICAQPDLAAEVTLQPIDRLGVDAAILFADILLPLVPMGIDLEFAAGEGPVIHNPVREAADVARLVVRDPEEATPAVLEAVRLIRRELDGRVPLIGFAGGPFTVASYLIEGGSSRHYRRTKEMMYRAPDVWDALMEKLADMTARYLAGQIRAGAQAVQLFDSWVGALSPLDYERRVLPYVQRIVAHVAPLGVPVIVFGTGTAGLLSLMATTGADVVGIDWRIALDDGWARVGHDRAVQGNLDPLVLFAPREEIERHVRDILARAGGRPGHIFNLGHGILPETPVDNVRYVVELVHELTGT